MLRLPLSVKAALAGVLKHGFVRKGCLAELFVFRGKGLDSHLKLLQRAP